MTRIVLTGGSSLLSGYIAPLLPAEAQVTLISRRPPQRVGSQNAHWRYLDLAGATQADDLPAPDILIHLAPLPLIRQALEILPHEQLHRIIAFGTTSRLTKAASPAPAERRMVREQAAAEEWLADYAAAHGIAWTLFRPTMVYDGLHDKNVALIARFIRRFGFFPLVGEAAGRRQPVHAADLAQACSAVLGDERTYGKSYNLPGGETLNYRDMVDRVFRALGKRPRYVRLPPALLRKALAAAAHLPRYRYLNPAMAERMNQDMVFDAEPASQDFGYRPQPFKLDFH